jgi:hypothetical protein
MSKPTEYQLYTITPSSSPEMRALTLSNVVGILKNDPTTIVIRPATHQYATLIENGVAWIDMSNTFKKDMDDVMFANMNKKWNEK